MSVRGVVALRRHLDQVAPVVRSPDLRARLDSRHVRLLAVLAVVGVLIVSSCQGNGASSTTDELVVTAEEWFDLFESAQVEEYQSLMAADAWWRCDGCKPAIQEGTYFGGKHGADLTDARDSLLLFAAGGSITPVCMGEGQVVICETRLTDAFRDHAGLGPYQSRYQFTFEGSLIADIVFEPLPPNDRYQTGAQINAYAEWLRSHDLSQYERLFFSGTMLVEPLDKAAAHRELIRRWVGES